jgi:ketosteroid isomerase-like protein
MATIRFPLKHIAVERIFALGATNAVTAEWDVVETDQQGRTYRASGVTVLQARDGKLVRVRDYIFDLAPLEEAWRTVETTTSVA